MKDKFFHLHPTVATIIAQIACHDNALPQGSPSSPFISNFVANILDVKLLRLCKRAHCTYTRYADDLTFSTNERLFPLEIAEPLAGAEWMVGRQLQDIIESNGFKLNPDKTRMSLRRSRQSVTGLVVNAKVNIRQEYYRFVRAMCDSVFKTGTWHRPLANNDIKPGEEASTPDRMTGLRPLEGMLTHIYFVKGRHDRTPKKNKLIEFAAPKAPIELYRRLLFYKHFVANELPIIVTEGVSDVVYLKCAINSLAAKFPTLVSADGKRSLCFLNPSGVSRAVLNLGHGASGQGSLIEQYARRLKHYRHLPLIKPVIILCDNDDGLSQVTKIGSKVIKNVSKLTTDSFYHLGYNLYLVKIPEGQPPTSRDAEDLFPTQWLSQLIDQKPFDKKKDHGDHTAYGKVVFAERIVRANAKSIDFSGFEELLQRIAECIADYATRSTAAPPVQVATSPGAASSGAVSGSP